MQRILIIITKQISAILWWHMYMQCSRDKLKTIKILLDNKCVRKTNNKVCNERELICFLSKQRELIKPKHT